MVKRVTHSFKTIPPNIFSKQQENEVYPLHGKEDSPVNASVSRNRVSIKTDPTYPYLILLFRSQESIAPTQVRTRTQELRRAQSADELSAIDYDMFEQRRESAQSALKGEMSRDGYMRMKQSSRGSSVDETDRGFQMGTVDLAIGGIGAPNVQRGSSQFYGMEEQEMTFSADNGGRHYYELEDGGYRTEEWYARGGHEPGRLRDEGFREIHVEHQPIYHEIENDNKVSEERVCFSYVKYDKFVREF